MAYYLPWGMRLASAGSTGDNADRIVTALAGYTVPFTYNAPADPVTTSSATVNTSTLAANIVAGRQLTLQAGAYGSPTFNVDDLDVICESGVTFTGMTISGNRFRITGGGGTEINGLPFLSGTPDDVMFDNVFIAPTGGFDSVTIDGCKRLCFKNVTLDAVDNNWGLIGGGVGSEDLIIVQSLMTYTGTNGSRAPVRAVGWNGLVAVNNCFRSNQAGPRFHNESASDMVNFCFAQNQLECGLFIDPNNGDAGSAARTMDNGWVIDNNSYRSGVTQMYDLGTQNPSRIQDYTITGNRGYGAETPDSDMYTISATGTGNTISDNLNKTYVSTPSYSGGAT